MVAALLFHCAIAMIFYSIFFFIWWKRLYVDPSGYFFTIVLESAMLTTPIRIFSIKIISFHPMTVIRFDNLCHFL